MSDNRQGAKLPAKQGAGYAGMHESRQQHAPSPQLGGKVTSSQAVSEGRRNSSETGGTTTTSSVKGLDLKSSGRLSQILNSPLPQHHQAQPSPRSKPSLSEPINNPYVPRPASRAMRDIYHQADRPMSRGLRELDTRPMSRGGVAGRRDNNMDTRPASRGMREVDIRPMSRGAAAMSHYAGNSNVRSSFTQEKFNRAGGATPASRPQGSAGALSSMPANLFVPPPAPSPSERLVSKDLSGSLMTRDPGSPGSPSGGSRGELRPPPPAGMRGALSWGVGPNAYEVDGRPGTRGGGPSTELDGAARPGTRGGRPASRMRGDSSGSLPMVQLAPLDGMDPPAPGKSLPEGVAFPPPSSQGKRDGRLGKVGQSQQLPVGSSRKPPSQSFPPGHGTSDVQPFIRQSMPENDLDQLIEALSDDGHELQDEKSIKDLTNFLNRTSANGDSSSSKANLKSNGKKGPAVPSGKTPKNQKLVRDEGADCEGFKPTASEDFDSLQTPSKSHSREPSQSLSSVPEESKTRSLTPSKSTPVQDKLLALSLK